MYTYSFCHYDFVMFFIHSIFICLHCLWNKKKKKKNKRGETSIVNSNKITVSFTDKIFQLKSHSKALKEPQEKKRAIVLKKARHFQPLGLFFIFPSKKYMKGEMAHITLGITRRHLKVKTFIWDHQLLGNKFTKEIILGLLRIYCPTTDDPK